MTDEGRPGVRAMVSPGRPAGYRYSCSGAGRTDHVSGDLSPVLICITTSQLSGQEIPSLEEILLIFESAQLSRDAA